MRTLTVLIISTLIAGSALADGRSGDPNRWTKWQHSAQWNSEEDASSHPAQSTQQARWDAYRERLAAKSSGTAGKGEEYGHLSDRLRGLKWSNLNSGVCDDLRSGRGGLRMLCVAFCELQDCQPDYSLDNPFENCSAGSERILARYEARRGAGDPDMPCIQQPEAAPECPCWTRNELAGFRGVSGSGESASCARNINSGTAIRNYDFWMISNDQAGPSPFFTNLASIEFSERDGSAMCSMVDSCQDGNCVGTSRYLPLTPEQFAACEADVSMAAADRGLNCIDM